MKTTKIYATYLEWQFRENGRPELFNAAFDYDTWLMRLTRQQCYRWPTLHFTADDHHDTILEILQQTINAKTIKACRAEDDPIKYFGGMFKMRLVTKLKNLLGREQKHRYQSSSDERTHTEWVDAHAATQVEHEGEVTLLLEELRSYLSAQKEAKYFLAIFNSMLAGMQNNEIASKLGVSAPAITRYYQRMLQALLRFGEESGNEHFQTVLMPYLETRRGGAVAARPSQRPQ